MASKYAKVIDDLDPLPAEDPGYQEKVDKAKAELKKSPHILYMLCAIAKEAKTDTVPAIVEDQESDEQTTYTPESMAKLYHEARTAKDHLEDVLSEVQLRLTALEQMLVASNNEDEPGWGMYGAAATTVRLPSGYSVRVEYEPVGKVEDKEAFRQWCVGHELEKSLMLWPSTTQAIVKERLLAGQEAPGGVKCFVRSKIKLISPTNK
jgi:hypothetical protein